MYSINASALFVLASLALACAGSVNTSSATLEGTSNSWQNNKASIIGRVVDQHGHIIRGAVVSLTKEMGSSTDSTGNFEIQAIPPGEYTISASYISYETAKYPNVRLRPNSITSIDFKLVELPIVFTY